MLGNLKRTLDNIKHSWNSEDADLDLYSLVAEEIEAGSMHKGLWLKALSESASDEARAKAKYTKYRVAAIRKVMPEIADLIAFQQSEAESIKALDTTIDATEKLVRSAKSRHTKANQELVETANERASIKAEQTEAKKSYREKVRTRESVESEYEAIWRTRMIITALAVALAYGLRVVIDFTARPEYWVIYIAVVFVFSLFVIRGVTYKDLRDSGEELKKAAGHSRMLDIKLAQVEGVVDEEKQLRNKMDRLRKKFRRLGENKEKHLRQIERAQDSISQKLSF